MLLPNDKVILPERGISFSDACRRIFQSGIDYDKLYDVLMTPERRIIITETYNIELC